MDGRQLGPHAFCWNDPCVGKVCTPLWHPSGWSVPMGGCGCDCRKPGVGVPALNRPWIATFSQVTAVVGNPSLRLQHEKNETIRPMEQTAAWRA